MNPVDALYHEHAKAVFRFSVGLCGDAHQANDLVAETFIRAMLSSTPIVTETVRAYLCTIARRLYLKEWHHTRRHVEFEDVYEHDAAGPEQQAMAVQSMQHMLAALQRLPETDRAALLMRAEDVVPYEDIARVLEISLSSAKTKVSRSRLKLALYLKEAP